MSSILEVATEQLRALAGTWNKTAAAVADNGAVRSVGACARAMPGSHISWAGDAVAKRLERDLLAARVQIEDMARSAEATSADYRATDGSIAATFARLGER